MARIVTTTYRYEHPPKRRKLRVDVPVVVTSVDPKKSRRPGLSGAAAEGNSHRRDDQGGDRATVAGQSTRLERADRTEPSTAPAPQRDHAVITAGKAPATANDIGQRRSAIVTAPDRKTVQRQREQLQMAKLMAIEEVSPETKDLVDRMMLGRWPGSAPPKKP